MPPIPYFPLPTKRAYPDTLLIIDGNAERRSILSDALKSRFSLVVYPSIATAWEWLSSASFVSVPPAVPTPEHSEQPTPTKETRNGAILAAILLDCSLPQWEKAIEDINADPRFASVAIFWLLPSPAASDEGTLIQLKQAAIRTHAVPLVLRPQSEAASSKGITSVDSAWLGWLSRMITTGVQLARQNQASYTSTSVFPDTSGPILRRGDQPPTAPQTNQQPGDHVHEPNQPGRPWRPRSGI